MWAGGDIDVENSSEKSSPTDSSIRCGVFLGIVVSFFPSFFRYDFGSEFGMWSKDSMVKKPSESEHRPPSQTRRSRRTSRRGKS